MPHTSITRIGLAFNRVTTNAATKIMMLMMNLGRSVVGEPKLSLFINNKAAAAMSPIIAGRKGLKMSCTNGASL